MSEKEILYITGSRKEDFQKLNGEHSPLQKLDNKYIFILSMVMGYKNESRVELGSSRWNVTRTAYLDIPEESLIKAIAIASENSLNVLLDKKKVYSIAEEYASGGIKYLKDKVFGKQIGSFNKVIESELLDDITEFEKEIDGQKRKGSSRRA